MDRAPAVSVVIVTRDRPELLADALASVAAQRLPPLEVCLGDDGVTPLSGTPSAGSIPVRTVRCGAGHAAATRNRTARLARGRWLAFLDDDDRWTPEHLAGLAGALAAGAEIVFRDAAVVRERITEDGARHELARRVIARDWDPETMRTDDYVPPSALVIARALFERLGGFDETMRYSEDWDLLLRAARLGTPKRVPGVTVEVRMRDDGNLSAERGAERRACLDALSARHGLPALEIRTFWEVAGLLGSGDGVS
jgi:glycosyltransferase involved in cell wall biosynthesis